MRAGETENGSSDGLLQRFQIFCAISPMGSCVGGWLQVWCLLRRKCYSPKDLSGVWDGFIPDCKQSGSVPPGIAPQSPKRNEILARPLVRRCEPLCTLIDREAVSNPLPTPKHTVEPLWATCAENWKTPRRVSLYQKLRRSKQAN